MKKTLLIDFDNVIHKAGEGYKTGDIYDGPVKGAVFTLNKLISAGYDPKIFTAREQSEWPKIRTWLRDNGFPKLVITNKKTPALAYIDNRAIRFISWSDIASYFL